ncbi:hypothetical protein ACPA9J_25815 [Pseudomonas aeruginosa]
MIDDNRGPAQLVESSEGWMLTAVERAIKASSGWCSFGWKPHPMNSDRHDLPHRQRGCVRSRTRRGHRLPP